MAAKKVIHVEIAELRAEIKQIKEKLWPWFNMEPSLADTDDEAHKKFHRAIRRAIKKDETQ